MMTDRATTYGFEEMDGRTFDRLRTLVHRQCGIALNETKRALVTARVRKRLRALGIDSFPAYYEHLAANPGAEVVHLVDVISTNVTSFYREPEHFAFIAEQVRAWWARGQKVTIWSAACSTGEEPYSVAMALLNTEQASPLNTRILATDIALSALERCRNGVYSAKKVAGVPKPLLRRYFDAPERDDVAPSYTVNQRVRELVTIGRLNLIEVPYPMRGPFDLILCRNVMIYFDNPTRQKVLAEMHQLLRPGGFLLVGHAESLTGWISDFRPVRPSIFTS